MSKLLLSDWVMPALIVIALVVILILWGDEQMSCSVRVTSSTTTEVPQ